MCSVISSCHVEQITDCSCGPLNAKLCCPTDVCTLGRLPQRDTCSHHWGWPQPYCQKFLQCFRKFYPLVVTYKYMVCKAAACCWKCWFLLYLLGVHSVKRLFFKNRLLPLFILHIIGSIMAQFSFTLHDVLYLLLCYRASISRSSAWTTCRRQWSTCIVGRRSTRHSVGCWWWSSAKMRSSLNASWCHSEVSGCSFIVD